MSDTDAPIIASDTPTAPPSDAGDWERASTLPQEPPVETAPDPVQDAEQPTEAEPVEQAPAEPEKPGKRGGRQQDRIDQLTREKHDAFRLASGFNTQIEDLKRQIAALQPPPRQPEPPAPSANGKPTLDKFDTYEAYTEALADWKVEQRFQARDAQQQLTQQQVYQQQITQGFQAREAEFAKTHPDYFAKKAAAEHVNLIPPGWNVQQHGPAPAMEFLLHEPDGPAVVYHLVEHPEDVARILQLPPRQQYAALGRLAGSLPTQSRSKSGVAGNPPVSRAPAPISPENGSAPTAQDLATMDFGPAYIDAGNKLDRKRR